MIFLKNSQKSSQILVFPLFSSSILSSQTMFAKSLLLNYPTRMKCCLCPRKCGADRDVRPGFCKTGYDPVVNLYKLHHGEEPVISGTRGSGTVFFSGCNLGCIFCQNHEISFTGRGTSYTPSGLSGIYSELESSGAHNINLVTPMHFAPAISESLKMSSLSIPVAVNTGGYDSVETLKLLDGLVDIYMPDFKFWSPSLSQDLARAADYREVCMAAIDEMYRQTGSVVLGSDGLLKKGLIVRHLSLPGQLFDSKHILEYLSLKYGNNIYISLMSQYTPMPAIPAKFGFLQKTVNPTHYWQLNDLLCDLGQTNAFVQDISSIGDDLIPDFR